MRKIVVPTDFSENSMNALQYACQAFKYEKSEFVLLHAYADEVYREGSTLEREDLEALRTKTHESSEQQLKAGLGSMHAYSPNPKHKVSVLSVFGTLTDAINDLVNEENMDIVVMGTRGKTNDRNITFGSNTVQVLKYVHCPVLAIPSGYAFEPPKKILFPTNYLIPYKRRELKLLGELAESFRSVIHLLYIDPVERLSLRQEDNLKFLKEALYKSRLVFETSAASDKVEAITGFIRDQGTQLLVMVNSRHTHTEDMLFPSTVDQLGLQIPVPFLILQNLSR